MNQSRATAPKITSTRWAFSSASSAKTPTMITATRPCEAASVVERRTSPSAGIIDD